MTIHVQEFEGSHSLTFEVGDLAVDTAIRAAGFEPNGYFWEGVVQFGWPELAANLDFDSEGSMFAANGDPAVLSQLRAVIEPLLSQPDAMADLIERARAAGANLDS